MKSSQYFDCFFYCVNVTYFSYIRINSMAFSKQEIIDVEKHIQDFKGKASMVMCGHNNDNIISGIGVICHKCEVRSRYDNEPSKPVKALIAQCPVCKDEKKIVTINLQEN